MITFDKLWDTLKEKGITHCVPDDIMKKKADVSLPMWCGRKDSNLHALAPEPKSGVSANSTTSA